MFNKLVLSILAIFAVSSTALAADCSEQFSGGKSPQVISQPLANRGTELCFEQYAVFYSGTTRSPIWTAEYLTKNRIGEGKKLKRFDSFHEENLIPTKDRAYLSDFKGSGFDRGHMAPNKDFSTYSAAQESFSLSNMILQNSNNNQNLWEGIESATRTMVTQRGRLYVVTGPIFDRNSEMFRGRIMIPSRIFKAIYDPVKKQAAAYITYNREGMDYETLSIAQLEMITGLNIFPDVNAAIKQSKMDLPTPTPHGNSGERTSKNHSSKTDGSNVDNQNVSHVYKALKYLLH